MITPYNILRHELIGLWASVSGKSRGSTKDLSGEITAETKNTITLKTRGGTKKTIPKKDNTFRLKLPGKTLVEVEGTLLAGRPQDRTKKKIRIT